MLLCHTTILSVVIIDIVLSAFYCVVIYCFVLCCHILYFIVLSYNVLLYCIVLCCIVLHFINILYCIVLLYDCIVLYYCIVLLYCIVLSSIVLYCIVSVLYCVVLRQKTQQSGTRIVLSVVCYRYSIIGIMLSSANICVRVSGARHRLAELTQHLCVYTRAYHHYVSTYACFAPVVPKGCDGTDAIPCCYRVSGLGGVCENVHFHIRG
jgi:hypothetical protein